MSLRSATETLTVVWSEVMFDVIMDTTSLSFQNYIRFFPGDCSQRDSNSGLWGWQPAALSAAPQRRPIWCGRRLYSSHATLFRFLNNIRKQRTRYLDILQRKSKISAYIACLFLSSLTLVHQTISFVQKNSRRSQRSRRSEHMIGRIHTIVCWIELSSRTCRDNLNRCKGKWGRIAPRTWLIKGLIIILVVWKTPATQLSQLCCGNCVV